MESSAVDPETTRKLSTLMAIAQKVGLENESNENAKPVPSTEIKPTRGSM